MMWDVVDRQGAEFGGVQLPVGDETLIVAQRGLTAAFLQAFMRVRSDDGCAYGRSLSLLLFDDCSEMGRYIGTRSCGSGWRTRKRELEK